MTRNYRPAPPPLETSESLVTGLITAGWAIALIVVLLLRQQLPDSQRWWIWTCATGFGMGLFGLWYVPRLKRRRAAAARRRQEQRQETPPPGDPQPGGTG